MARNEHVPSEDEEEISFIDLLIVVAKHKIAIAAATLATAVVAAVVALVMPNIYTGIARILPPQQNQSAANAFLGQLGALQGTLGSSVGLKNPADLYVGMLKSRTIADNIIRKFDFQKIYGTPTMVQTRKMLGEKSNLSAGKDGLITIEFEDEDPLRAAEVANAYIAELDQLTQMLAVTEAAQRRLFFERQLSQAKTDLSGAEVALKSTQEKTGLIQLDGQGRAIIEAVATLRAQISAKEVELGALRTFATERNPDRIRAEQQLNSLREELAKFERAKFAGGGTILLSTGQIPEAGLEYLRKFRDLKYQENLLELLAKQFELAKIDEAKEAAIIQVVDRAVPPDRKSKPRRTVIVLASALAAGLLAVLSALLAEISRARARQDPQHAARLATLREYASFARR